MKHRIVFFTVSALLALLLPFCALLLPTPSQPGEPAAPSLTPTAVPAPTPTPTPAAAEPFVSVYDAATGNVRQISLTDFMVGLAACEMPPDWPEAALCAQMAAGYSYALSLGDTPFSVNSAQCLGWTDTDVLQARWGDAFSARYTRLTELACRVGRAVLLYDGAPAAACYHSISTGHTEASQNVWLTALPYLQGVDSPADRQAPGFETTVTYSAEQTAAILQGINPDLDPESLPNAEWFGPAQNDTAGYVYSQTVCGIPLRGTKLRQTFGLRSAAFTVLYNEEDDTFVFTTHGYGHGVGMSQYGTKALAEQGYTWQEILLYYFPGCEIQTP